MTAILEVLKDQWHQNSVTGCFIWDGEVDRKRRPTIEVAGQKYQLRSVINAQITGVFLKGKNREFITTCENDRCIKPEHFIAATEVEPEQEKPEVAFSPEELERVADLYFTQGIRQDAIAKQLNTSRSRIAKMIQHIKHETSAVAGEEVV